MLIVCPSCASEYTLDPERIGAVGRKVRCAACRESWFIMPPPAAEHAGQPARFESGPEAEPEIVAPEPHDVAPAPQAAIVIEPDIASPPARPRRPAKPAGRGKSDRRRRSSGTRPSRIGGGRMWRVAAAILLLVALPAAFLGRGAVVQALPGTAILFSAAGMPVNLVGLAFDGVASTMTREGDAPVLVVTGGIVNVAGRARPVPPVEIVVEGEAGDVLYAWTVQAGDGELAAAATIPFRARLGSPPPAGKRVLVTFRESGRSKVALR